MHHSRLSGFIIDCRTGDLPGAAAFWGRALGLPILGEDGPTYLRLDGTGRDLTIEVQRVEHESRVHLDLESDDVEAEASRLEALGAKRIGKVSSWIVLEAPTGQRFCVVDAGRSLAGVQGATAWP